jgi:uncharacterized glyoxalase superfamily protein PhnB
VTGFRTQVTATLSVRDWARAMDFYGRAFGATELYRVDGGGVGQIAIEGARFHSERSTVSFRAQRPRTRSAVSFRAQPRSGEVEESRSSR